MQTSQSTVKREIVVNTVIEKKASEVLKVPQSSSSSKVKEHFEIKHQMPDGLGLYPRDKTQLICGSDVRFFCAKITKEESGVIFSDLHESDLSTESGWKKNDCTHILKIMQGHFVPPVDNFTGFFSFLFQKCGKCARKVG